MAFLNKQTIDHQIEVRRLERKLADVEVDLKKKQADDEEVKKVMDLNDLLLKDIKKLRSENSKMNRSLLHEGAVQSRYKADIARLERQLEASKATADGLVAEARRSVLCEANEVFREKTTLAKSKLADLKGHLLDKVVESAQAEANLELIELLQSCEPPSLEVEKERWTACKVERESADDDFEAMVASIMKTLQPLPLPAVPLKTPQDVPLFENVASEIGVKAFDGSNLHSEVVASLVSDKVAETVLAENPTAEERSVVDLAEVPIAPKTKVASASDTNKADVTTAEEQDLEGAEAVSKIGEVDAATA